MEGRGGGKVEGEGAGGEDIAAWLKQILVNFNFESRFTLDLNPPVYLSAAWISHHTNASHKHEYRDKETPPFFLVAPLI